jgi:hypothetical protein
MAEFAWHNKAWHNKAWHNVHEFNTWGYVHGPIYIDNINGEQA